MTAPRKTWMQRHTWQVYAAVAAIWLVLFAYQLAVFASPDGGSSPLMMVLTGGLTVVYGVLAVMHRRRRAND